MGATKVDLGEVSVSIDVQSMIDLVYPVGCIYQSFNPTNPSELFGGTWEQITGRFLRASNDTGTGGSDTVTLTVEQMPSHTHGPWNAGSVLVTGVGQGSAYISQTNGEAYSISYLNNTGGSKPHNNMPAYQNVYTWKRTA